MAAYRSRLRRGAPAEILRLTIGTSVQPLLDRRLCFDPFDPAPRRPERLLVSLAVTAIVVSFYRTASSSAGYISDIDQVWHATRALLGGLDPYTVVAPGGNFDIGFPLYYPLPALLAFAPFALLSLELARLAFVALSAAVLAYAVTGDGWHRLPIFLSGAYVSALASVQWSPLITAAFLLPWLGPVLLLKPNVGLAIAVATPRRVLLFASVGGGGALLLISMFADPSWPGRWLSLIHGAPHFTPPVLLPGGFLVLLALLRWRRPEARLLVALACVPHTTLTYEALPVLLVARRWRESLLLAALSFVVLILQVYLDSRIPASEPHMLAAFTGWVRTVGTLLVALVYLPATAMVLRRPNEGEPPAWIAPLMRRRRRD
jgi:hypothetical protein